MVMVIATACTNNSEVVTPETEHDGSDVGANESVKTTEAAEVTANPVNTEDYLPKYINNNEEELAKYDYIRTFYMAYYGIAIKEGDLYYCYATPETLSAKNIERYAFQGIVYYPELDLPYNMTSSEALKLAEEHPDKYHCDTNLSQLAYFYEFKNGVDTNSNIVHFYNYSEEEDLFMINFDSEYNGFDTGNQAIFRMFLDDLESPENAKFESISMYKNYIYDANNMTLTYKNEEAGLEYHYIYNSDHNVFLLDPAESHVEPYEFD
jgi:hypothetical protein